jgi:uncharacterized membrane protein
VRARILGWLRPFILPAALLLVHAASSAVLAQTAGGGSTSGSVIPSQLTSFLCANYNSITNLTTIVLLVVAAVLLIHGLVIRRSSLVFDLIIDGIIALVITNLRTILTNFGLSPQGCP